MVVATTTAVVTTVDAEDRNTNCDTEAQVDSSIIVVIDILYPVHGNAKNEEKD